MFYHVLVLVFKQKITDFDEICEEIARETERVTGNNKVYLLLLLLLLLLLFF